MTSALKLAPYIRRYDRELVSKPVISLKHIVDATVERLFEVQFRVRYRA